LDRGFITAGNVRFLDDNHASFISALPANLKEYKRLVAECADTIHSSANKVSGEDLYVLKRPAAIDKVSLDAYVFYSPGKASDEEKILYAKIERMESELEKMASTTKPTRRYTDLFDITTGQRQMTFSRNAAKIDAELKGLGYFILITNDKGADHVSCLDIYRGKDIIEKAFSGMKNHLDFKRLRTHTQATTDGKLFCGFIALILRSVMAKRLSESKVTKGMPIPAALRELRKLKRISYANGAVSHTAITKKQRGILEALGITPESLIGL
jgi:transposase